MPSHADYAILALCLWREDRSGGREGMIGVGCCVRNRVARAKSSFYEECVKPWQFSSLTAKGDPQLTVFPAASDPLWSLASAIAETIIDGTQADVTGGATNYYAASMTTAPSWAAKMTHTVDIGGHRFYK